MEPPVLKEEIIIPKWAFAVHSLNLTRSLTHHCRILRLKGAYLNPLVLQDPGLIFPPAYAALYIWGATISGGVCLLPLHLSEWACLG